MNCEMDYHMFILCNIDGIGYKTVATLLNEFESAGNVLAQSPETLKELIPESKYKLLCNGIDKDRMNTRLKVMSREKIAFVPFTSSMYPERLRHIPDPPLALYVKGDLPFGNVPAVAVVGARECSEYGALCAKAIGKELGRNGINVISGFARGIDSISQQSAIEAGGKTYGVLGGGVDFIYPPENKRLYYEVIENGGLISEYPVGTEPKRELFPARNRLISGLSDIVVVVEARVRSGTYITVTQALEQNREVMVVPGRITDGLSVGCNALIKQGAAIISRPEDVIDLLSSMGKIKLLDENLTDNCIDEADEDNVLLKYLDITPTDVGILLEKVKKYGYSYEKMCSELTVLQIEGKVIKIGNSFAKTGSKSHI